MDGAIHQRTMVAKEVASLLPTLSVKEGKSKESGRFPIWRASLWLHITTMAWLAFLTLRSTTQPEPGQSEMLTTDMIRQLMAEQEVRKTQVE